MYNLVYISTAIKLMNEDELGEILVASRDNNFANDVTGLLLYSEGTFIQVLEGEQENVEKIYSKILKDLRHKNAIELATGNIAERNFPGWAMGFSSVNSEVLKEFKGYIDPSDNHFLKSANVSEAVSILKGFAESNGMS
ncbi:MAG: BLUF domain-containing protein [Sphingobacteriaceae bacterium]|nr:MAG: BLUF domain-containing protein [Sphingobacteriaceae bacterium]